MTLRLILASASPARTKLLAEAGIAHTVTVSDVDEDAVTAEHGTPSPYDTAQLLARAKAEAVAALPQAQGALVIGCDSVFEFEGEAHGKPYEVHVARTRIRRMSGSHGSLHTGHWLVDNRHSNDDDGAPRWAGGAVASAKVHFMPLDDAEIEAYIATGEPLHCAGSFTIDGRGGAFIRKVDGDPHAVVGLSISTLRELLREAGVSITELWR